MSYGTHTITFSYLPTTTATSGSDLTVVTNVSPSTALVVVTHGAEIDARNIEIMWQSTDEVVVSWFSNIQATTSTPVSTQVPTPEPTPATHKLSPGAIAGIVVGAIAFLAFIVFGVLLFLRRRKNRRNLESDAYDYNEEPSKLLHSTNCTISN